MNSGPRRLLDFYENKTESILRRYGPGPRVHYHTGLLEDGRFDESDPHSMRELLRRSQERLLEHAARVWRFDSLRGGKILDVGCGLGGGALFLAQEFGAQVTALTIAPSHARIVAEFAARAGVSRLVAPRIGDAIEDQGENEYDAAIAIDSSSSFPRAPWFDSLAKALRRPGRALIADCMLVDPRCEEPFNNHWCARIGTLDEYIDAARAAGFELATLDDISVQAANFWSLSLALMRFEAENGEFPGRPADRMEDSRRMHAMVRDGLAGGGLRQLMLGFRIATAMPGPMIRA